jgi:Tol biopolymer transport system component
VSVDSAGAQGNGSSVDPHTNGRQVVFESDATNLVAGDTNGTADIFVHDLKTGVTTRVSVDSAGVEGDDASRDGILDPKGRLVVFFSDATNLVAGDVNATQDAFLRDLKRGTTTRVSVSSSGVEGNLFSTQPYTNGRQVVFRAAATNLVPGDANGETDIFVHDRKTGITTRASVDSVGAEADGDSDDPTISPKGDLLAFESDATNLLPGDGNGEQDVFVRTLK